MIFPTNYKCLNKNTFSKGLFSIVPIRFQDRMDIMKWRNEQIYHLRQSEPLTEERQNNYFENVVFKLFEREQPNQILFSYLQEDKCIGYGGLVHINWIDKNAEISFIIDTELEKVEFEFHWLTYLSLIEQVAFVELCLHKIFTFAFDLRPHLYQAVEKAGFFEEAQLKEHYLCNGKYIDAIIHSKFNCEKLKICILASGKLGYENLKLITKKEVVNAIFTDKNSNEIIIFAKENGIPLFVGNPRNGKATNFILSLKCDLLLSINYLFIIEKDLIAIAQKYAINIHGSLLPKYRGRTPHVWAIINGEKETGITAHTITENVDDGFIVFQEKISILPEDTGATILNRFLDAYPKIINKILNGIKSDSLTFVPQDESLATYFGKRVPDDGKINWDWHAQQIIDWIRAQAKPYPGAFSYYKGHKLIINKAILSHFGFIASQKNGTILRLEEKTVTVKVSNASLVLEQIDDFNKYNFEINTILE